MSVWAILTCSDSAVEVRVRSALANCKVRSPNPRPSACRAWFGTCPVNLVACWRWWWRWMVVIVSKRVVFRPLLQLWKLRWRAKVWESVPQCSPQSMYAFQHQEPRSPVVLEWRYLDSVDLFGNLRLSPDFETPDFYDTPQHEEDENVSWVIMPDQRRYCMTGHTVACL